MPELDLAAIRARADAISDSATWSIERCDHPDESNWELCGISLDGMLEPLGVLHFGDVAQFVVHAFADVPALLARIAELEARP